MKKYDYKKYSSWIVVVAMLSIGFLGGTAYGTITTNEKVINSFIATGLASEGLDALIEQGGAKINAGNVYIVSLDKNDKWNIEQTDKAMEEVKTTKEKFFQMKKENTKFYRIVKVEDADKVYKLTAIVYFGNGKKLEQTSLATLIAKD